MPRLYAKLREISKCSVILAVLPASAQGCYEGTRAVGVDGEEPLPAWPTGGQPSPGDPPDRRFNLRLQPTIPRQEPGPSAGGA